MATESKLAQLAETGVGGAVHHPLFPPSASDRWLTCTASPQPIAHSYQGDDFNVHAAEGSLAHSVFADLVANKGKPVSFPLASEHVVDTFTFTITQEMVDYLDWCLDILYRWGPGVLMSERRVGFDAGFVDGVPMTRIEGTADLIHQPHEDPCLLHVGDLKYGKGVKVYAQDNAQMMLYALGVLNDYTPELFDSITTVRLHVLQPRLDHHDSWDVSVTRLLQWARETVDPAVVEVFEGGQFRPSTKACRWCPIGRAGDCEAQIAAVLDDFEVIKDPPKGTTAPKDLNQEAENAAALMPVAELDALLCRVSWLERVTAAMRERAKRVLLSGEEMKHWKMVPGRGGRAWRAPDAMADLIMECGVDPLTEPELKTPPMVEKEMGRQAFANSLLVPYVEKVPGRPTLAPIDDPRPAWADVSTDDFEVIEP